MKLLLFPNFLVLVTLAVFDINMAGALPSPEPHNVASKKRALDVLKSDLDSRSLISNTLRKRFRTDTNCLKETGQNWSPAPVNQAQSAVNFLKATTRICQVGPTDCVRISCVEQAAVYLCNNNEVEIHPSCFQVSGYAQALIDKCPTAGQGSGGRVVGGQAWDNENWNVFIRGEDCSQ